MNAALIALGLQRDLLEADGRMPIALAQVEPLVSVANAVIAAAEAARVPVIYVVNAFPRSQWFLNFMRRGAALAGSPGAELDPRVRRAEGCEIVEKEHDDAFTHPRLQETLAAKGIDQLFVMGVFASSCVRKTALSARRARYAVTVIGDAVGGSTTHNREGSLAIIASDGASVVTSEVVLRAWSERG